MVLSGDKPYHMNHSGDTFVPRASPRFEVIRDESTGRTLELISGNIERRDLLRTRKSLWCVSEVKNTASAE
jgi:hypothetical protein